MITWDRFVLENEKRTCLPYPTVAHAYKQSRLDAQLKAALKQSRKLAMKLDIMEERGEMLKDEILRQAITTINQDTTSDILYIHSMNVQTTLLTEEKGRFDRLPNVLDRRNLFLKNLGIKPEIWHENNWKAVIALLYGPYPTEPSKNNHWSVFCYFKHKNKVYHYDSIRGHNRDVCLNLFELMGKHILLPVDTRCYEPDFYPQQDTNWDCGYRCIQCVWTVLQVYRKHRNKIYSENFPVKICCSPLKEEDLSKRYRYVFDDNGHESFSNLFESMLKI